MMKQNTKSVSKTSFNDCDIANESIITASINKPSILLNSHNYLGMTALDIAKSLMYSHYYELKDYYGDKIRLMHIDTDGIILNIDIKDLYKDMKKDIFHDREIGYFKNEDEGMIDEFVCLKAKVYCKKMYGDGYVKKGVQMMTYKFKIINLHYLIMKYW